MRIFLDANILFSAAKSEGAIRQLLSLIVKREHVLCVDAYVVEEGRRNLALKHPGALPSLEALLKSVSVAPAVHGERLPASRSLPEKDRPVLEAAIRLRCDVLITGDKTHFGALYGTAVEGVQVLSPAQLANELL